MLYARRVIALHDGRIAADGAPETTLNPQLIRLLYGVEANFLQMPNGILIAPVHKNP